MKKGKKTKKMAVGGIGAALGATAAKAIAAKKPMGLGEGIARAAGVPVGKTVNAPATIQPIGGMRPRGLGTTGGPLVKPPLPGMRPPGLGTTGGPLVKPLPPGIKLPPDSGMGGTRPPVSPGMVGLGQAMSNLGIKKGAGNVGSMIGQRFGGLGMKKGGKVSSASKRADGIAQRGKTRGKMV